MIAADTGADDKINASILDLSAWKNRTTDYEKRFDMVNDRGDIQIHVYKD
jgi:hypothetical protein